MSAWHTGQVVGGSSSAIEPHAGHTRRSQQAGSPGRSSSSRVRASALRGSAITIPLTVPLFRLALKPRMRGVYYVDDAANTLRLLD
jgi:hypothetical protein